MRLFQLLLHRAYLNQRFPRMAESMKPLIELAERRARLQEMQRDYYRHFVLPCWTEDEATEDPD